MDNIIKMLYKAAMKSEMNHRHGCIITYGGNIISSGYNHCYKKYNSNNCEYLKFKYSVHAEICAIKKIKNKTILKKCTLYVIRIKNNQCCGTYSIEYGYPCEHCMKIINKYKINFKNIINFL